MGIGTYISSAKVANLLIRPDNILQEAEKLHHQILCMKVYCVFLPIRTIDSISLLIFTCNSIRSDGLSNNNWQTLLPELADLRKCD